jgi:excisionase family DNA binding protein
MNDIESILRRLIREEIRAAFDEFMPQIPSPPVSQSPTSDERLLLSTRDAAKMLDISARTLFSLTQSGQLPCVRIGSSKRYSIETLKQWIQASESQTATHPQKEEKARIEAQPGATASKDGVRRTKAKRSDSKG